MAAITEQVTKFEALNVPIGKAVALTVGMGLGDVVKAVVRQWNIPPLWTGIGLAWALLNVRQIKSLLGPETTEIVAAGILADTINDEFRIQEQTANLLAGFFGQRVVSNSPPVLNGRNVVSNAAPAGARTDIYRGIF